MKLETRSYGILLPVFSLPGNGTLDGARETIDFFQRSGVHIWQVLPLGPPHSDLSPYLALSSRAGNPALIGRSLLCHSRNMTRGTLAQVYQQTGAADMASDAFQAFAADNANWLPDFALYLAIRESQDNRPWFEWPSALRQREPVALGQASEQFSSAIDYVSWQQFVFHEQWQMIRCECEAAGIALFGDVPLYVSHDSADVWQHQDLFCLTETGSALSVAGVPPDYFSPTGQRWGNPLYDWDAMTASGYAWWLDRMKTQANLFDIVRIDHFRGLEAYWSVPASAATAETGEWCKGPGAALLEPLVREISDIQLVAEDLGTITAEVDELRRAFVLPGIRVLQFGYDGVSDNPHHPDNLEENTVLYTGTHDNDTTLGWYQALPDWQRDRVNTELARFGQPMPYSLIECAFASRARTVIIPMQDLLGLDSEARTNTPGTTTGNWQWRLRRNWQTNPVQARVISFLQGLKVRYAR
ncbi:MAG: 4-alpha-glucanotransferase [Pseudomonadota bacterium]